ncbi:hypothetical protein BHF71_03740 [Vulcanibacillus modesticaldus]|uniref:CAAX prenyl protease 2/Lysostaphin resistance protein A-like domain-containing protein n=1 Tax=Vulcanibacillus modesticaldus TaxID=337097 RepID=A0A1D2YSI3_9BACI|nr:CPBP family intramembrane glutamic endopeptidase [Vulcanibacillus modesticaldus]OEF97258.1 hypothetical protein BHF71_03740 [Vulcanibacillus modesticaldus]
MKLNRKINITEIDHKLLIFNLYLTQFLILTIALLLYYIFFDLNPLEVVNYLFPEKITDKFYLGLVFGILVVAIDLLMSKLLPKTWIDDGGINEKLFSNLSIWHIAVMTTIVGFSEELLFRGVLQSLLGILGTSVIFTIIHVRYLNKVVLVTSTFLISIGLGILVMNVGWFAGVVAHVTIDFLLGVTIKKRWLIYKN